MLHLSEGGRPHKVARKDQVVGMPQVFGRLGEELEGALPRLVNVSSNNTHGDSQGRGDTEEEREHERKVAEEGSRGGVGQRSKSWDREKGFGRVEEGRDAEASQNMWTTQFRSPVFMLRELRRLSCKVEEFASLSDKQARSRFSAHHRQKGIRAARRLTILPLTRHRS